MNVTYMNGAGNDFMVLDARGLNLDFSSLAKEYCALSGADGFMAVDESKKADFRLHFYNADGSRGEMCGNGARCICRYAYDLGLAGEAMVVETDAGLVPGWRLNQTQYKVQLNNPSILDFNRKGSIAYAELGDPGVPHAVKEFEGDLWASRKELWAQMRSLRYDAAFPKGANVNFYQVLGPEEVKILTYERGVEDFTLACGTGTGSVACVLWAQGRLPGNTLTVHNPGGTLTITISGHDGKVDTLYLEGPTEVVRVYEL